MTQKNFKEVAGVRPVDPSITDAVKYTNPAGDEYPVIVYNNVKLYKYNGVQDGKNIPATYEQIGEFLKTVKDCGFNVYLYTNSSCTNKNLLADYFSNADSLGLPTVLNLAAMQPVKVAEVHGIPQYKPTAEEIAAFYTNYQKQNIWGYFLADEPHYINWGGPANQMPEKSYNLALAFSLYNKYHYNKRAFFNLAVSTDKAYIGSVLASTVDKVGFSETYYNYLSKIYNTIKPHPAMMSVDYYPISNSNLEDTVNTEVVYSIKDQYYSALATIAKFSRLQNIPFWLFMLCNKHTTYNETPDKNNSYIGEAYPYPTEEILRFQAMTAIAFGIQGLVFWSYGLVDNKNHSESILPSERYYDAPFVNHKTTKIWDNCKAVIPEIKDYGKVLLGAKFQDAVQLYGDNETVRFPETKEFKDLPNKQFGCIKNVVAEDKGFVITHLKKGDKNFIAIVSHNFRDPQYVSLDLDNSVQCVEYLPSPSLGGIVGSLIVKPSDPTASVTHIIRKLSAGGILLLSY